MSEAAKSRTNDILGELVFFAVAALAVFYYYQLAKILTFAGPTGDYFRLAIQNDAPKPWQYRELLPFVTGLLLQLPFSLTAQKVGGALELASLFALIVTFRCLLAQFVKDRSLNGWLALTIIAVMPFHVFFPRPYHPFYWYDTPSIVFFTLGLLFMYQRRWPLYYAVFIIGTLNRETTCFLTFILVLAYFGRERNDKLAYHTIAQLALWLIIKGGLFAIYADNPGPAEGFELMNNASTTHLADNLEFFGSIRSYPLFFSAFAFLWIPVLLYRHWIADEFIRRAVLVIFPFFAGMFIVANIYELRIFLEILPLFLTAFILILREKFTRANTIDAAGSKQPHL